MRRSFVLVLLSFVALALLAALVQAPAWATGRAVARSASGMVYAAGSLVCHQQSARSFHLHGLQLPVCARCFGLYAGGALGVLGWLAFAGARATVLPRAAGVSVPSFRILLVGVAIPTLVSLVSAWMGVWEPGNLLRASLALPLGAAIGIVVAAAAAGDLR